MTPEEEAKQMQLAEQYRKDTMPSFWQFIVWLFQSWFWR